MSSIDILRGEFELETELKDKVIEELKVSIEFAHKTIDDKQKEIDKLTQLYKTMNETVSSLQNELLAVKNRQAADHSR